MGVSFEFRKRFIILAFLRPGFAQSRNRGDMEPVSKANYEFISPPPSPTSPEMRQIARKWELFVTGADVDLSDISPIIREAWIRSKQAGVDPTLPHAPWQAMPDEIELL